MKTQNKCFYADKDAQQFYDYAMKLGILAMYKELINQKADRCVMI